jgi:hypothetical protein
MPFIVDASGNRYQVGPFRTPTRASASRAGIISDTEYGYVTTAILDADFSANGLMTRTASGTYTSRTLTAGTGISVADGDGVSGNPTVTCDLTLDELGNPAGNKTFVMTTRQLGFLWTNPAGNPLELEASGAYSGALVHIHQHTGNPGSTYLVEIEAADSDVEHVKSVGAATTTSVFCTWITGEAEERFSLRSDGKHWWGDGTNALDTNLYRSAANVLYTDDAFTAVGNITCANLVTAGNVDGRDVSVDGAKLDGIESAADVTDATNVAAAGAVMKTLFDAYTMLYADTDDTPAALTVAASRFVGRKASGGIAAMTVAEALTLLDVEAEAFEGRGWFVYRNAALTANTGALTTFDCDTELWDSEGWFNTTTHLVTPTVAGWYYIGLMVGLQNMEGNKAMYCYLKRNASPYHEVITIVPGATAGHRMTGGGMMYFDGDDYAEPSVYHNCVANKAMYVGGPAYNTSFFGFLVKPD